jgi:hypothetical protein
MVNRFASLTLVLTLLLTIGGTSVFADTQGNADRNGIPVTTLPSSATPAKKEPQPKKEAQPDEKLRAGLAKLVADTKAGKEKLPGPPQFPRTQRNNLSKGAKIAIVAGIAAVVVVVIVGVYIHNHMFDDFRPFSQH